MANMDKDNGWAWMTAVGGHVNFIFLVGGLKCMGLVLVELVDKFGALAASTSVILRIMSGVIAATTYSLNALGARFTQRVVVIFGGIMAAVGIIIAGYVNNFSAVIILYGICSGLGYAAIYGPTMVVVGQRFEKYRSIANGIVTAGGSVGTLALPPLLAFLLREYSLRGAVLIYGGVLLHAIPAAMLFIPFPKVSQDSQYGSQNAPQLEEKGELLNGTIQDPVSQSTPILSNYGHDDQDAPEEKMEVHYSESKIYKIKGEVPMAWDSISLLDIERRTNSFMDKGKTGKVQERKRGICNLGLLKNPLCILFALAYGFGHAGYNFSAIYLAPFCQEYGHSKETSAFILSLSGACDLIGRLTGGWFGGLNLVRRSLLISISFFMICGALALMTLHTQYWSIILMSVTHGFWGGIYFAQVGCVVVDFVGVENLSEVLGFAVMAYGITAVPLPVILGHLKDIGSYSSSLQLCGGLLLLSGILFSLESITRTLMKKKRNNVGT